MGCRLTRRTFLGNVYEIIESVIMSDKCATPAGYVSVIGNESTMSGFSDYSLSCFRSSTSMTGPVVPANSAPAPSSWDKEVGLGESLIPIWGSGKMAIRNFRRGEYGWGTFNSLMAISDVFLVKSLVVGAGKIATRQAIKMGSTSWGATGKWLRKKGFKEAGEHAHHWLITQGGKGKLTVTGILNEQWGRFVPTWFKNQPWNLIPVPDAIHTILHKKGLYPFIYKMYYGTPQWSKSFLLYFLGRDTIYQENKLKNQ